MVNVELFLAVKYVSMCVNLSKKESLAGCMVRYVGGSVLRRYGLCTVDLRKPVCFEAPWFYVRVGRCIRRNGLESENLAWMCVKSCLPTRVFQRRRNLINNEQCPRETCGGTEHIPHIFWECGYAKEVWSRLKKLIKGLTDVECLTYEMVMFGLCGLNHDKARVLWFLVNCVKETLWDSRNLYVFKQCEINVNDCIGLIWARLFLYVISDKRKLGYDAEGIWKTKKWKSCIFS
ncbi:hypothetical protein XELAEV_18000987mg [Xenopus laevis]|nr:hypothetical protein XELAEV_18000987mg [Xenopus laevis]